MTPILMANASCLPRYIRKYPRGDKSLKAAPSCGGSLFQNRDFSLTQKFAMDFTEQGAV